VGTLGRLSFSVEKRRYFVRLPFACLDRAIGEALKRRSEVLQPVPQEMLTLLVQVNALREDEGE
jgi:hypothetical protein